MAVAEPVGYLDDLEGIDIPFEEIGAAYYKTWLECGRHDPENWKPDTAERFRQVLGGTYSHHPADALRRYAINWRKRPEGKEGWKDWGKKHNVVGKRKDKKNGYLPEPPPISKELEEHYDSDDYKKKRAAVLLMNLATNDGNCRVCGRNEATQTHHCHYNNIGKPAEIHQLIPACAKCHTHLDMLRWAATCAANGWETQEDVDRFFGITQ